MKQSPGGKLPLPEPRSPRELDQTILDYARDHAPQKRPGGLPAWGAGLATVAIVGIAVLISEPQRPAPNLEMAAPALEESLYAEMADTAAPAMASPQKAADPDSSSAEPKRSPMQSSRLKAVADDEQRLQQQYSRRELAVDSVAAGIVPGAPDQDAAQEVVSETEMASEALAEPHPASVHRQLHECARLLQQGEEVQAREAFRKLREACSQCGLPETLEQAIEEWP